MNQRQEQIVDNHLNNRCENIGTVRNGRVVSCHCAEDIRAAGESDPMADAPEWFVNPEGVES